MSSIGLNGESIWYRYFKNVIYGFVMILIFDLEIWFKVIAYFLFKGIL